MKEIVILEAMSLAKPERKEARKCLTISSTAHAVILGIVAVGVWVAAAIGSDEAVALAIVPGLPSLWHTLQSFAKKGGEL